MISGILRAQRAYSEPVRHYSDGLREFSSLRCDVHRAFERGELRRPRGPQFRALFRSVGRSPELVAKLLQRPHGACPREVRAGCLTAENVAGFCLPHDPLNPHEAPVETRIEDAELLDAAACPRGHPCVPAVCRHESRVKY